MPPRRVPVPDAPRPPRTERELVAEGPMVPTMGTDIDEDGFIREVIVGWEYECGCNPNMHRFDCSIHRSGSVLERVEKEHGDGDGRATA